MQAGMSHRPSSKQRRIAGIMQKPGQRNKQKPTQNRREFISKRNCWESSPFGYSSSRQSGAMTRNQDGRRSSQKQPKQNKNTTEIALAPPFLTRSMTGLPERTAHTKQGNSDATGGRSTRYNAVQNLFEISRARKPSAPNAQNLPTQHPENCPLNQSLFSFHPFHPNSHPASTHITCPRVQNPLGAKRSTHKGKSDVRAQESCSGLFRWP